MPSDPKAIPSSVRWAMEEANQEIKLNNLKDARNYTKSLRNLRQEYLGDLHKIIGQDKVQEYLRLHNERLKFLREARSTLPRTSKGLEKLSRLRRQSINKSDELIKGSGVDMEAVEDLQKRYANRAMELCRKSISKGSWPDTGSEKTPGGKNQTYTPPYLGEDSECFHDCSRGSAEAESSTNKYSGEVRSETAIRIDNADDGDFAFAICRPRVRIVKTMETPQDLTVRVQLEAIEDSVNGSYDDECGSSSYDFYQRLYVYTQRTWPERTDPIYTELEGGSYAHYDRIGPMRMMSWINDFSEPGETHTVELFLPAPSSDPPDGFVGIDVGIEVLNQCWVDDVSIAGSMDNRYLIQEIRLIS